VFIEGRVSVEEDRPAKLILESAEPFNIPEDEVWLQLADRDEYRKTGSMIMETMKRFPGGSTVVIYLKKDKAVKRLEAGAAADAVCPEFEKILGKENVRRVSKKQ